MPDSGIKQAGNKNLDTGGRIMNGLLALTIIVALYAIGDIVAAKIKAVISMMFVSSVVVLIAFWSILPDSVFADSQLEAFSKITIGLLLVHIGTSIKAGEFLHLPVSC